MNNIAVVFPGQGSQFVGMGKTLCNEFKIARDVYEEAEEISGIKLRKICFEGRISELNQLTNLFVSIITYGIASFKVFDSEAGIKVDYMAGHSLGEYAALVCAGVISLSDAVNIVMQRAKLPTELALTEIGTMTVIDGPDFYKIEDECRHISNEVSNVYPACYNSKKQIVVAGNNEAVMSLEDIALDMGAQVTPMIMMPPFHSPLMEPVQIKMKQILNTIHFNNSNYQVIANVTGKPYKWEHDTIVKNLSDHISHPVMWNQSIKYLEINGVKTIIEMGAHNYLSEMIKSIIPSCITCSYGSNEDWCLSKLSNTKKSVEDYRETIEKCLRIAVSTKNYSNSTYGYDEKVNEIYKGIEKLVDDYGDKTNDMVKVAIEKLKLILKLKQLPLNLQEQLLSEIKVKVNNV